MKHRGGTIEHPGEHVDRMVGLTFCETNDGGGHAHVAAVALLLADVVERRTCGGQLPHARLRLQHARPHDRRECVLAGQQTLHPRRGAERRQRLPERAAREAQKSSCIVHDQLGAGLTARTQRAPRPLEPLLGLIQAPQPEQGHRSRGQGGDDHLILAPAVRIDNPHRLLAQLEPRGEREAGQRAGDPEVSETRDLEPRSSRATSQRQPLLEVAPGIIQPPRPQLRNAQILQRDRSHLVTEGALTRRLRRERRLDQRPRLERRLEITAPAREHEPQLGQQQRQIPVYAPREPCPRNRPARST